MDVSVTTVPCGSEPVHELQSHLDTIKPYAYDLSTETADSVENALAVEHGMELAHDEEVEHYVDFMCIGEAR